MDIEISPGRLSGQVAVPPSKSAAHRALLCAALAGGRSVLTGYRPVQDMEVTVNALRALGALAQQEGGTLAVSGGRPTPDESLIDCVESGSTFRFLVPLVAALGVAARFVGSGRLPQRPISQLTDELARHGAVFGQDDGCMLTVSGQLQPGIYQMAGNVSSQYITGLLLALPLLPGDSEIHLTAPLESRAYVDMTIDILSRFGVAVEPLPQGYRIPGKQRYTPCDFAIEGDYSGAAFWLCANALGSTVRVEGLLPESRQGDRAVADILARMGSPLRGVEADVSQVPDLMPVLAVTMAFAEGASRITGAARLRLKESDRLATVTAGLRAMGASVKEHSDSLTISGRPRLPGGCAVESFGDHRIAMAMAIGALRCEHPVVIGGAHCVAKSYPDFWDHFKALGGNCRVL